MDYMPYAGIQVPKFKVGDRIWKAFPHWKETSFAQVEIKRIVQSPRAASTWTPRYAIQLPDGRIGTALEEDCFLTEMESKANFWSGVIYLTEQRIKDLEHMVVYHNKELDKAREQLARACGTY